MTYLSQSTHPECLIAVGDTVTLHSGSPPLLVVGFTRRGAVCQWANGGYTAQDVFAEASLCYTFGPVRPAGKA